MGTRSEQDGPWPFRRKFGFWLRDEQTNTNRWALANGLPQATVQRWVKHGVLPSAQLLFRVARLTGLSMEYWIDEREPYPPQPGSRATDPAWAEVRSGIDAGDAELLVSILTKPADRRKLLALWRASQGI